MIAGLDRDGRPVRYLFEADRAVGFDRVRLSAAPVRREDADGAVAEAASLPQFLGEVRAAILGGAHPDQLARFAVELEETRVKDVLAEYVRAGRDQLLADADHEALEGLITDGHRYHPAYKSRIGFDLDDDLAYGPEFLPVLHPFWVAAHRSVAEVTTSAVDPPDPRAELGARRRRPSTPGSATPAATRPTTRGCPSTRGSGASDSAGRSPTCWPTAAWSPSARTPRRSRPSSRSAP